MLDDDHDGLSSCLLFVVCCFDLSFGGVERAILESAQLIMQIQHSKSPFFLFFSFLFIVARINVKLVNECASTDQVVERLLLLLLLLLLWTTDQKWGHEKLTRVEEQREGQDRLDS